MLYLKASWLSLPATPTSKPQNQMFQASVTTINLLLFPPICPSTASIVTWPQLFSHHYLPLSPPPIHTPSLESVFHHYLTSLQIPLSFCCCCCWSPSWLQTCQVAHVGLELQSFLLLLPKYHERIPLFTPLTLSKASIFPHDFASSSALTIGSKEAPHVRKT